MPKHEVKFPLGNNLYLTLSNFRGQQNIHIRTFVSVPSFFDPNQQVVVPTKKGITITKQQLLTLKNNIDPLFSVMREQETKEEQASKASHNIVITEAASGQEAFYAPVFDNATNRN